MKRQSLYESADQPSRGSLARYLLAASRPRFWLYLAGPALVGVAWAARDPGDLLGLGPLAVIGYFLLPANLFLYGVNDRFDAPVDAHNPRKSESGPEVQYRESRWVWAVVLTAGALGLGLAALFVSNRGGALAAGSVLGFIALAVAYSTPPFRFKGRPPLDSVSNGLYVLPGLAGYVAVAGVAPPLVVVVAGWLWTMAMHTFSAIPDVEPDRAAGVATTATVLGQAGALAYCVGCWLAAALLAASHAPALGLLFGAYPVLGTAVGLADVDIDRAYAWFPLVNGLLGMVLTLAGLWRVVGVA